MVLLHIEIDTTGVRQVSTERKEKKEERRMGLILYSIIKKEIDDFKVAVHQRIMEEGYVFPLGYPKGKMGKLLKWMGEEN